MAQARGGGKAGELLIGLRVQLGISQVELAEKACMPIGFIARIESGSHNASVGALASILRSVGQSLVLSYEPSADVDKSSETGALGDGQK